MRRWALARAYRPQACKQCGAGHSGADGCDAGLIEGQRASKAFRGTKEVGAHQMGRGEGRNKSVTCSNARAIGVRQGRAKLKDMAGRVVALACSVQPSGWHLVAARGVPPAAACGPAVASDTQVSLRALQNGSRVAGRARRVRGLARQQACC